MRSSNSSQKELFGLYIQTLDKLMLSLHEIEKQGEFNMEKFKFLAIDQIGEIELRQESAETEQLVKEINAVAMKLKPGQGVPLTIGANTAIYNKLWELKKLGRIPDEVAPAKRGDKLYLLRVSEEQADEYRRKRLNKKQTLAEN